MMASLTLTLLSLLLVISVASAWRRGSTRRYNNRRFLGGSVTFTPKGVNSDGTYEVELRNRQTSYYCYQNGYTCYYGNCGSLTETTKALIAGDSYGLRWCQYEVVTKRKLKSNQPFAIRYPTQYSSTYGQGYWMPNIRSMLSYWRMMAHVDLGTRSDTGQANRSPLVTMLSVVRVTRNCPRSFNMTVFDPDGDRVRCRVAGSSSKYECGLCGLIGGFSLDQNSCSLQYTSSSKIGNHPIELLVEDFPNEHITLSYSNGYYSRKHPLSLGRRKRNVQPSTHFLNTTAIPTTRRYLSSIAPLSKLPLQFSVYVDSHQPSSCLDGDFFPIFLAPTPSNGENVPAFVNRTLELKVVSFAQYSKIYRLLVTGPKGISQQKTSTEEYVIKWTPTENELNDHFPICFVSEALDKSSKVYHSEMRCVIVDVGHHETTVTCNETTIMVEVEKTYLIRRNEDTLHLNDYTNPSCNLTERSNSTHLVAVMSLNTCGTIVEEDEENIIFKNEITSADPKLVITRHHDVEIAFSCAYPKRTNVTLAFKHKNPYAFKEKGFGSFTFQFEFYDSQRFRKQKAAKAYPMEVYLKQMIFMEIEATTAIPNTELFVESCKATPYDNPKSRISYTIIENGCVTDETVQIYPGPKSKFRFGMKAFEFIGAHEEVYVTCSVLLCETGISGTRCSQGCVTSNSGKHRGRREAAAQSSSHLISQGPLRLVKTDDKSLGLSLNLGLNIVFIVGCVLVGAVVVYRRRSAARYTPLPTSETD